MWLGNWGGDIKEEKYLMMTAGKARIGFVGGGAEKNTEGYFVAMSFFSC